jgi:hypothetical protein
VDPWTREYLDTADRNRDFARTLLRSASLLGQPEPPHEWIAVIAFYAAVHYVNAFIWERYRVEPADHFERGGYVNRDRILRRSPLAYVRLRDEGFKARYVRGYRVEPVRANQLVNVDLANVESVVRAAL